MIKSIGTDIGKVRLCIGMFENTSGEYGPYSLALPPLFKWEE